MLSRRSLFGTAAAGVVAAPAIAAEAAKPATMQTLTMAIDASPFRAAIGEAVEVIGQARSFEFSDWTTCRHPYRPSSAAGRYVYRTGDPAIDALRSVSGVHKARMEKRLV